MKKASGKGLKLESFFEKEERDDLSADDIMPAIMKPTLKPGKTKSEMVFILVCPYYLFCCEQPLYVDKIFFLHSFATS